MLDLSFKKGFPIMTNPALTSSGAQFDREIPFLSLEVSGAICDCCLALVFTHFQLGGDRDSQSCWAQS